MIKLTGVRSTMLRMILLPSLLFLPSIDPVGSQSVTPDFRELENTIKEELKETNTPGAAISIVSGDRVIFTKGFGVANVETGAQQQSEGLNNKRHRIQTLTVSL